MAEWEENNGWDLDAYEKALGAGDTETAKIMLEKLDPDWARNRGLGGVTGRFDNLYALTDMSAGILATINGPGEGNLFIKASGQPDVTANQMLFKPVTSSGMFNNETWRRETQYKPVTLSVETQKMLKESGVDTFHGVKIPDNPQTPLDTGGKIVAGNINDAGVFSQITVTGSKEEDLDRKYVATARVPDSFNYHFEINKNDHTIPMAEKGHAQYQRPMELYDSKFETELAKARYLAGMEPYLDEYNSKKFDHFTYWKYKTPNTSNAFSGAYVHIFISRPDLHIFDRTKTTRMIRSDIGNCTDLASLVYMYPESALSLTQKWQTGSPTDINLFLSNKACGISIGNDQIDDHQFVEAYTKIKPVFGGRMDNSEGDVELTFNETQDLAVSNTILMWMKYIHATYTGQISALVDKTNLSYISFNTNMFKQHPIWRRMDSLASIYVIATDMTQRNIIFWRKYFGVYPKSTAFAGLSKDGTTGNVEGVRKIQIPFRYVTFRTNNIVDLYAFNKLSDLQTVLAKPSAPNRNDNPYQTRDPNTSNDHDVIAGLPFVVVEQHYRSQMDVYNNKLPIKMYNPQLLFSRSDGAFIPMDKNQFISEFVGRYWAGISPVR